MNRDYQKVIERKVGKSLSDIQKTGILELRNRTEEKHGRRMFFKSQFPFMGRGNVLRDRLVPHEAIEECLDKALGLK